MDPNGDPTDQAAPGPAQVGAPIAQSTPTEAGAPIVHAAPVVGAPIYQNVPGTGVFQNVPMEDPLRHNLVQMYRRRGYLSDFSLWCSDREFKVHRLVLAANSPYFNQMFMSHNEGDSADVSMIEVDALNVAAVERVIDYFYSGFLQVTWPVARNVMEVLDFFELEPLVQSLADFIMTSVTPASCFPWLAFAADLESRALQSRIHAFLHHEVAAVYGTEEFLRQDVEVVKLLLRARQHDNQDVHLKAVFRWCAVAGDRHRFLPYLLKSVNLEQCSQAAINQVQRKYWELWTRCDRYTRKKLHLSKVVQTPVSGAPRCYCRLVYRIRTRTPSLKRQYCRCRQRIRRRVKFSESKDTSSKDTSSSSSTP